MNELMKKHKAAVAQVPHHTRTTDAGPLVLFIATLPPPTARHPLWDCRAAPGVRS